MPRFGDILRQDPPHLSSNGIIYVSFLARAKASIDFPEEALVQELEQDHARSRVHHLFSGFCTPKGGQVNASALFFSSHHFLCDEENRDPNHQLGSSWAWPYFFVAALVYYLHDWDTIGVVCSSCTFCGVLNRLSV